MDDNSILAKNIVTLKSKIMIQRIDRLYNISEMLLNKKNSRVTNSLKIIKEQYERILETLIEKEDYEKYKDVEDIIIEQISKVELDIDQHIYNTIQKYTEVLEINIKKIRESEEFINFKNIDKLLKDFKILKEVLKLYSPYVSKNEEERLKDEISTLKFEVLYRKQVEQLIYEGGGQESSLLQFENEKEKKLFLELLKIKISSLTILEPNAIENDEILRTNPEDIFCSSVLLERLIIIDMKRKPNEYINLLKAKVFNAHLCNIENNPFEQEVYLTENQLHLLGFGEYGRNSMNLERNKVEASLKANRVNYSLLRAILKSIITDENISIIECEKLYKKFGFECRPIATSIGEECIKMINYYTKGTKEYERLLESSKKSNDMGKGEYCKIDFEGLIYDFDNEEEKQQDFLNQILSQRKITNTTELRKRKFYSKSKNSDQCKMQSSLQDEKDKIKERGWVTYDIKIIISLINDIIDNYRTKIDKLKIEFEERMKQEDKEDWFFSSEQYGIKIYEIKIEKLIEEIKKLEQLNNRKLTLEEKRYLLLTINSVYSDLNIKYNPWRLLPLENIDSSNSKRVYLAPIPEEIKTKMVEVSHSFLYGSEYEKRQYHRTDLKPLCRKYKQEFEELKIDVKKYSGYFESTPHFKICVKLEDISDLPIDYEKVTLLSKDELEEVIEREEGKEI